MKRIVMLLVAILFAYVTFSQTNFSGTWELKSKTQVSGQVFIGNMPVRLNVKQDKDSLVIERTEDDQRKVRLTYAMDQKATIGKSSSGAKSVKTLTWSGDKKTVTLKNELYEDASDSNIEAIRIATLNVSDDRKQLFYKLKSIEKPEGWEVLGVFEKK